MNMQLIKWIDARSVDGWAEPGDVDARGASIKTMGWVFDETADVVCIGGSISEHRAEAARQYAGIMLIPKRSIVERSEVTIVPRAPGLDEIGLIEQALKPHFPNVEAYRFDLASIRVRIIDEQFKGKSNPERDDMVDPLLRKLPEDIRSNIVLLLLWTQEEADCSPTNAEFEHGGRFVDKEKVLRQKVLRVLRDAFPPPARVELQEGEMIIAIIVSDRFADMDSMGRHVLVHGHLTSGLLEEEARQVYVVAVTPKEYIGHSTGCKLP